MEWLEGVGEDLHRQLAVGHQDQSPRPVWLREHDL